jgi:hypothetical protein
MNLRNEPGNKKILVVRIKAKDRTGETFTEQVLAKSLSNSGALLSGVTRCLRSGDLLWVEHAGRRSRFKVVWVRDSETLDLIQAVIHLMKEEPCPWAELQ